MINTCEIKIFAATSLILSSTKDSDNDYMCDTLNVYPCFDDYINKEGNSIIDNCDICVTNRVITYPNFENETIIYSSVEEILSIQTIFDGAVITFDAGSKVLLDVRFEVQSRAEFSVVIMGCTL